MTISLAALEAADKAATERPWRADDEHGLIPGATPAWCVSLDDGSEGYVRDIAYTTGIHEQTDAELIALYRNATPQLAQALRAVLALADKWDQESKRQAIMRGLGNTWRSEDLDECSRLVRQAIADAGVEP
ncbi:hypothetical protein [Nakamurella lactea]|uniref:hypothetical protein n=1 Tax=Nakamurella lactea TaxID=459515 RepID=UPI00041E4895|nr:hypothetical protein [Nakamurella lactea]